MGLMQKLYKAGSEHRKYLRQIMVSMDITAPLYWIAEFDTYKIGVTRNSCSFMHKGLSRPFNIMDFSVHDEKIYDVLTPPEKKEYQLTYPYETEEYRDYVCHNGRKYKVYKNGRIFSYEHEYTDTMGRHRVFKEAECVPSPRNGGYYELNIGGRNGEKWAVHRLVATVWIDNPDKYYTVNHINGNKGDNSVENLEWCELADNIRKGMETGLYDNAVSLHSNYLKWKRGHVLVDPLIKAKIIESHKNGKRAVELAEEYGVTVKQINNMLFIPPSVNNDLFLLSYSWETIIDELNSLRDIYLDTRDDSIFQQIRCSLPSGYNLRFTITMNYENVINMIKQRSSHRLNEWREYVEVLYKLPYIKEIIGDDKND